MSHYHNLLTNFLEHAKSLSLETEPIKVLRSNTFRLGESNVLIRIASDLGKRYFFGINYIHAEEIYNLSNSFIAFICGDINRTVILPSEMLLKCLPQISHDRNGEYKINFTRDLKMVLRGRGNTLDCSEFVNNWDPILKPTSTKMELVDPIESFHSIIQGRLIEIGNIRGFGTFCPDKSRKFNKVSLREITTIKECPGLQYSDYDSLRRIDVIWFRKAGSELYPDYAFEVELSTGVWSGFGRLATLKEYNTKMYIITNEEKKFRQVLNSFPELDRRYINVLPDQIGLLYSAEKNLIKLREAFDL